MKVGIYSINDSLSGFLTPAFELNDQVAMRNFEHAVLRSDSLFFSHPEHYSLYCVGTMESDTGQIFPVYPPQEICAAQSIILKSLKEASRHDLQD